MMPQFFIGIVKRARIYVRIRDTVTRHITIDCKGFIRLTLCAIPVVYQRFLKDLIQFEYMEAYEYPMF